MISINYDQFLINIQLKDEKCWPECQLKDQKPSNSSENLSKVTKSIGFCISISAFLIKSMDLDSK